MVTLSGEGCPVVRFWWNIEKPSTVSKLRALRVSVVSGIPVLVGLDANRSLSASEVCWSKLVQDGGLS